MLDRIMTIAFEAAHTAIFKVGSLMAVLMLVFGYLDYRYGDKLRRLIDERKLDKPVLMALLALIPVDGTLLFQYNLYRRRTIRFGSLLGGIIGIGEEATYLILTFQPTAWLALAAAKLLLALGAGSLVNAIPALRRAAERWRTQDQAASRPEEVVEADENFHELPDKFRHKLHHFRYHRLGTAFWIFFGIAFLIEISLNLVDRFTGFSQTELHILGIPFISWLSMLALFFVIAYWLVVRLTTREFGKIFDHEFEDVGDAVGDLAETCASVILLIFGMTLAVNAAVELIGMDRIAAFFTGKRVLAVLAGALTGLIPGTGASLAFTSLYFGLAGSPGALPFASLAACSIALIGDSQFIGRQQLRRSQNAAHWMAFAIALANGLLLLTFT